MLVRTVKFKLPPSLSLSEFVYADKQRKYAGKMEFMQVNEKNSQVRTTFMQVEDF
jgi:hypothetical protein